MTITLTVEELRAYEKACEKWVQFSLEKELFQHLLKGSPLDDINRLQPRSVSQWLQSEIDKISKELAENPIPKLIPAV